MSDTPKTDRWEWEQECNYDVPWEEHCRELERENAELKKQANDEFDTVITRNMELVRENGRLRMALDASCNAEELRQVRAENAALREKISELEKAFAPNFVRELHIACLELERENAALLKALKEIAAYGPHDGSCGYGCDLPGIAMAAIDAARKEAQP